jgi:hypothetical protein
VTSFFFTSFFLLYCVALPRPSLLLPQTLDSDVEDEDVPSDEEGGDRDGDNEEEEEAEAEAGHHAMLSAVGAVTRDAAVGV